LGRKAESNQIDARESGGMKRVAPEVKDVIEEEIAGSGSWHQKFTLFMPGEPMTEQPFDRTGSKLDLSDPQVRIDLWRTLRDSRFND
jgi:hypothetical protein